MRLALWYPIAVTVALSLAFLDAVFDPGSTDLVLWILTLILFSPVLFAAARRGWNWLSAQDLFSPLIAYPLCYITWFVIGSLDFVHLPSSVSFGAFDPIPSKVFFYAGVGLVGYFCGAWASKAYSDKCKMNGDSDFRFTWDLKPFRLVILVTLLIAAGSYLYVALQTGIVAFRPDAGEFVYELDKYHLIMQAFFITGYTAFLFLVALVLIDRGRGGAKKRTAAITALSLLMLSLLGLGSRSAFVPPVLASIVLYHYLRKPIRMKEAVAIVLVLFMTLSVFGYLRSLTVSSDSVLDSVGLPAAALPFLYCYLYFRYTVATFRDITNVIPAHLPFQHGAITFMPFQSLLPGHHYPSDIFFKNLLGNDFNGAGQPATVLGPFYADFGAAGIFAGMLAWGIIMTALYKWMLRNRTEYPTIIYAWATQAGLFGMFGGMFIFLGTLLIPLFWVALNLFMEGGARRPGVLAFSSAAPPNSVI